MNTKSSTSMRLSTEAKALLVATATRAGVSQAAILELAVRAYAAKPACTTEEHYFPFLLHSICPRCETPITLHLDIGTVHDDPAATLRISQERST